MLKIVPMLAAAALLALIPSDASAWSCRAASATGGWGVGASPNRNVANQIALRECAIHTPRGVVCWTSYCRP